MPHPAGIQDPGGIHEIPDAVCFRCPEVTWRTNKLGFGAPVDAWARQVSLEYLLSLIRNAKTAPYFWQDALEALALRSPVHPAVFEFLTMESFARQFDVSV